MTSGGACVRTRHEPRSPVMIITEVRVYQTFTKTHIHTYIYTYI